MKRKKYESFKNFKKRLNQEVRESLIKGYVPNWKNNKGVNCLIIMLGTDLEGKNILSHYKRECRSGFKIKYTLFE